MLNTKKVNLKNTYEKSEKSKINKYAYYNIMFQFKSMGGYTISHEGQQKNLPQQEHNYSSSKQNKY